MPLGRWSISLTFTLSKQCITRIFFYWELGTILGLLFQQWEDFHNTKENRQKYCWYTTQEPHVEVCLNKQRLYQCCTNCTVDNQEIFQTNSSVNSTITRNKLHLHRPIANLSCCQQSTLYADTEVFNIYHPVCQCSRMTRQNFQQPSENTYIRVHPPFTLQINFLCARMICSAVFCKIFVLFYT